MSKVKECILVLKFPNITFNPKGNKSKHNYITPATFEKHLLTLLDWRFNPLTPDEFRNFLFVEYEIPFKSFLIVFEDGYKNIREHAYPILKRYKIPALIFLVVNHIGDYNRWADSKEELLSIEDITELNKTTMINFGLQTKSNKILTKLTDEELDDEIIKSKLLLEEMIRYKVQFFNYPYNKVNSKVIEKLEKAEIPMAFYNRFAEVTSLESFHKIPAIRLSEKDGYLSLLSKIRRLGG